MVSSSGYISKVDIWIKINTHLLRFLTFACCSHSVRVSLHLGRSGRCYQVHKSGWPVTGWGISLLPSSALGKSAASLPCWTAHPWLQGKTLLMALPSSLLTLNSTVLVSIGLLPWGPSQDYFQCKYSHNTELDTRSLVEDRFDMTYTRNQGAHKYPSFLSCLMGLPSRLTKTLLSRVSTTTSAWSPHPQSLTIHLSSVSPEWISR